MNPLIELIHFQSCPNAGLARANLRQALSRSGLRADWTEWDLESEGLPERARGYGSPTVLVNGVDVTGGAAGSAGMSCRADGAPAVEVILRALEPVA